jgi:ribose-phosphate pyrophosphokinase
MGRVVFGGSSCEVLAREVGSDAEIGSLTLKKFPDGERYIKIETDVQGSECIVVQSICRPQDENLWELLSILSTLRDLEAEKIVSVVPYYGYGRQDKRFNPGECLTAKVVAQHIQLHSDEFLTINLHHSHILDFFDIPSKELDASSLLGNYFKEKGLKKPTVVAPDEGAQRLAKAVADKLNCEADYLEKTRLGPGEVEMKPKTLDVKGKEVILVDDIIDSGGTMFEAMKMLKARGAEDIWIGCVHPVLTGNIVTRLYAAGARDVVATNTIPSQISRISVAPLIKDAL